MYIDILVCTYVYIHTHISIYTRIHISNIYIHTYIYIYTRTHTYIVLVYISVKQQNYLSTPCTTRMSITRRPWQSHTDMRTRIYVHICVYAWMCMHVYIHTYLHMHTLVYVCTHSWSRKTMLARNKEGYNDALVATTHMHAHMCIYTCMYTYIHVHVCIHTYMYMYVYTYTYLHMHMHICTYLWNRKIIQAQNKDEYDEALVAIRRKIYDDEGVDMREQVESCDCNRI